MIQLPDSYIQYVNNGGATNGDTYLEWADYFDLEPLDKVADFNNDIEIKKYAPEFIAFASNGGGEVYVFNKAGAVFLMPLIGMGTEAAITVSNSWLEFMSHVKAT